MLGLNLVEDDLPPMPVPEGYEEPEETIVESKKINTWKRKTTRLKRLTSNKLLTRLPILLAQIKTGNNSYKF